MFDPPITTTGTIIESPEPKLYVVSLPNGKTAVGHVAKVNIDLHVNLTAGVTVELELTPFDLTKARIVGIKN